MPKNPINILLIEDNENDAVFIREILAEAKTLPSRLQWETTLAAGIAALKTNSPAVVLLDLSLPDSQGIATVVSIRKQAPNLPIVVLTVLDDEETGVNAIREGAQDFIVKQHIDEYTLRLAIRYAIERQKLISNIRQLKGLLPICSHCQKIRNDEGYWQKVEEYIRQHSEADFSHSLCPDCVTKLYPGLAPAPGEAATKR